MVATILNPLVSQGTLNRVSASVSVPSFPQLNVTASYLGRAAIRLALTGEAVRYLNTLTGATTSPEVYLPITCTMHLIKAQPLSALYKSTMETDSLIGAITVRPDLPVGSNGLTPYDFVNCSIMRVIDLEFSGENEGYVIELGGIYYINSFLFGQ